MLSSFFFFAASRQLDPKFKQYVDQLMMQSDMPMIDAPEEDGGSNNMGAMENAAM